MNITLNKQSEADTLINITLEESDYQSKVEEKIKEYSRKVNIKGFRHGKVPTGVVKKMYGKSILVDLVDHLISDSLNKYIKENKLLVLGEPIANLEKAIDWDNQKNFEFEFKIGYVEDYQVDFSAVTVNSYTIEVDQKTVEEAIQTSKERYGTKSALELSDNSDLVFINGVIKFENEHQNRNCTIEVSKINPKQQNKFIGVKNGDTITFQIEGLSDDANLLARLTGKNEDEAKMEKGEYVLEVTEVFKIVPAELNQETFDKIFGTDVVKNIDEFENKIKETIQFNYNRETNHYLEYEIRRVVADSTFIKIPEEFLKQWIKISSKGSKGMEEEVFNREFNEYKKSVKWDLIVSKITKSNDLKVEEDEIKNEAKQNLLAQFGNIPSDQFDSKVIDDAVMNYLTGSDRKGDRYMQIYNFLLNRKAMDFIKEKITKLEKKVSLEEFKRIVDSQNEVVVE